MYAVLCVFAVLVSLSLCRESLKFCRCWLFGRLGVFSVGLTALMRIQANFEPLAVLPRLGVPSLSALVRPPVLLSVMRSGVPSVMGDALTVEGVPLPYYVLMRVGAVLPHLTHFKNIYSKTKVRLYCAIIYAL